MKRNLSRTIVALLAIMCISSLPASNIRTKGKWGDNKIRSLTPACPVVSLEGSTLSIYLADILEDLSVTILDSDGNIVHQDCITTNQPGDTHVISLEDFAEGKYTIVLSHIYGYLMGVFEL
jgi:hypothetical protein